VSQRSRIAQFAIEKRLPSVYSFREYIDAGGLVAYTPNYDDARLISPIFTADSVSLHVSPEKDGKSDLVYARIGRCQGRPAWRGACAAVPRRYV